MFTEFEGTSAAEIPTVVKPFSLGFEVKMRKQSTVTFHYLSVEDNWNNNYIDDKQRPTGYPVLYYAVSLNEVGYDADVAYQLSFCPHYGEGQLARYIASYAKGNEVDWLTRMQQPLEVLVRERLPVYHGGWLYIAVGLLFEKLLGGVYRQALSRSVCPYCPLYRVLRPPFRGGCKSIRAAGSSGISEGGWS